MGVNYIALQWRFNQVIYEESSLTWWNHVSISISYDMWTFTLSINRLSLLFIWFDDSPIMELGLKASKYGLND